MQKLTGALAKIGGVAFARGGRITALLGGTVSLTPPSLTTGATGSVNVTVTGAGVGDLVVLEAPAALEAGLVFIGASVTATNTITARFYNPSAGTVTGTARSWGYRVVSSS
jgi:hypothetical protein